MIELVIDTCNLNKLSSTNDRIVFRNIVRIGLYMT
jgi:hypothetical protein